MTDRWPAKTGRSPEEDLRLRKLTQRIEAEAPPSIDADLADLASKLGSQYPDVEHFRPKKAWQAERGRPAVAPGYFWLAYEWNNLLLSCKRCNTSHKRNLFPLVDESTRARPDERDVSREVPAGACTGRGEHLPAGAGAAPDGGNTFPPARELHQTRETRSRQRGKVHRTRGTRSRRRGKAHRTRGTRSRQRGSCTGRGERVTDKTTIIPLDCWKQNVAHVSSWAKSATMPVGDAQISVNRP